MSTLSHLRLPFGRRLAYHTAGGGTAVLYCHGFPSSGHEIDALPDLHIKYPAHWIAPDRPGYGASDHDPARTAESLADDYAELLDRLGLESVAMLCVSGGTPGTLAFIRRHPKRVRKLAVLCGLGFMGRGEQRRRMPPLVREGLHAAKLARWMPDALFHRWSRRLVYPMARVLAEAGARHGLPADRLAFEHDPQLKKVLDETFQEAFNGGGPGMARDLRAWTSDDGAWLGELRLPVQWWHGTADTVVPFAVGAATANAIPGAVLHAVPDAGHFSLIRPALPKAIAWLIS